MKIEANIPDDMENKIKIKREIQKIRNTENHGFMLESLHLMVCVIPAIVVLIKKPKLRNCKNSGVPWGLSPTADEADSSY